MKININKLISLFIASALILIFTWLILTLAFFVFTNLTGCSPKKEPEAKIKYPTIKKTLTVQKDTFTIDNFIRNFILVSEGNKFVSNDNGAGACKYGILQTSYGAPVKELTHTQAVNWYLKAFLEYQLDTIQNQKAAFIIFDILNWMPSSKPLLVECLRKPNPIQALNQFHASMIKYINNPKYSKGWYNRIANRNKYLKIK